MSESKNRQNTTKIVLTALYVVSTLTLLYYLWDGWDYYQTFLMDRPHHPDHLNIKPGGVRGHGLGILGTLMMLLLLTYSLRKRKRIFGQTGELSTWLNVHIFFGIMGPLFVILHTAFKLNGIVAISFWSMIAVALSGVLGRYLYLQIPRNISGQEIGLNSLQDTHDDLVNKITANYPISEQNLTSLEELLVGKLDPEISLFKAMIVFGVSDFLRFSRTRRIKRVLKKQVGLSRGQIYKLLTIIKKKSFLHRKIIFWNKIHRLFHYWHVIHKPFAVVMYLIMIIHVALTVVLGYRWIF